MKTPKFKIYFVYPESFDAKVSEEGLSYTTSVEHPCPQYVCVVMVDGDKEYPIHRIQSLLVRGEELTEKNHRQAMSIDFYGNDLVDLVQLEKSEYEEKFGTK